MVTVKIIEFFGCASLTQSLPCDNPQLLPPIDVTTLLVLVQTTEH